MTRFTTRPVAKPWQYRLVGTAHFVVGVIVVSGVPRSAAAEAKSLYDRLWPTTPEVEARSWARQIEDQLTELGNQLGYHLDLLTMETISLAIDGPRHRARVTVGTDDDRYLTLRLSSDIHFTDGLARVSTRVDLGVRGRKLELELPEMDVAPTSYRGERGVEVRLPLFRRRW